MRLGVVVGEGETWRYFQDTYNDLVSHYEVKVLKVRRLKLPLLNSRVNSQLLRHDLNDFIQSNDVVFFEWASNMLAYASQLPKRCRMVVRLHRYEMFEWVARVNWGVVDTVIVVSEAMRKKFAARVPEFGHKAVVIPEGISIEKFQTTPIKECSGNIGTLCFVSPRKRVYELILAFSDLSRRRDYLHLHIGGSHAPEHSDYFDAIQRLVEKLNLREKVTFYGEIADAPNWYNKIDVFVSNSYSEGLQVALLEAMASGRYCLSHWWDGVEELLSQEYLFYTNLELQRKLCDYFDHLPHIQSQEQEKMRTIACAKADIRKVNQCIRDTIDDVARHGS